MHEQPKNRDWVKNAAIIFLAVLLVLTFFSNTIMNRSLPEVATQDVTSGSIVARVRGTGTVTANTNSQVKMEKTRVIRSVLVKVGQQVEPGDVLFTLGEGSSEDIDAAEENLMNLQNSYNRTAATMPEYHYATDRRKIDLLDERLQEAEKAMLAAKAAAGNALTNQDNASISDSYIAGNLDLVQKELEKAIAARDAAKKAYDSTTRDELTLQQWKDRQASIVPALVEKDALDGDLISSSNSYSDRDRIDTQISRIGTIYTTSTSTSDGDDSGNTGGSTGNTEGSTGGDVIININAGDGNVTINTGSDAGKEQQEDTNNTNANAASLNNTSNGVSTTSSNEQGDHTGAGSEITGTGTGNENAGTENNGAVTETDNNVSLTDNIQDENPNEEKEIVGSSIEDNNLDEPNEGMTLSASSVNNENNQTNDINSEILQNNNESSTDKEYEIKAQEQNSPQTGKKNVPFSINEYSGTICDSHDKWEKDTTNWENCLKFCLREYDFCENNIFLLETDVVEAYEAAVKAVDKWSDILDQYLETGTAEGAIYKSRLETYRNAKDAYDTAVEALNDKMIANQQTIAGYNVDLANTWQQIEKAKQKLADLMGGEEAQILAKTSGVVQTIECAPGDTKQKDDILCTLELPNMGYNLSFSVTNDQAARLRPGDTATVSNFYWGTEITATLNNIKVDPKNPQTNKLLTFDLSGNVTAGSELTLSVGQKSANYDIIIPSSAIRTDANGSFVLKVESKNSPLGNRYIARRVPVEVLASDDSNSAVSADLGFGDYVITTSSAPVKNGELVRLATS